MKIKNLKINGFGKLENMEINLSDNINLIYGKNEAGKTSLLKFISGMFYGISKNKNKKEFSDFERYKPWKAKEFSGKIKYKLDNNNEYEVFRDFAKKNPQIYNEKGEDISKNFNIDKTKGNEFFLEQTKIDESMFFSTTLIEQKNVVLESNEQALLTQKIANILTTGEENTSYKKTIDKLNKKLVEEVGTERTVGRPLNIVLDKLEKINQEKDIEKGKENLKQELENKKNNIKNKIKEKEIKLSLIKEIKKIYESINIENEKIKINKNLKEEEILKIDNLENKIKENSNKKNKNNLINIISIFILIFLNIFLYFLKFNNIIKYTLIASIMILIFLIILKTNKNIKQKKEKNKKEKIILDEINLIEKNINNIQKNIEEINNEKFKKEETEKKLIQKKYNEKIEAEELEYLLKINLIEINTILEQLEKEISTLKLQSYTNDIDYNNAVKKEEEKAKKIEIESNLLEEKRELINLGISINIAKEALDNAYKKMKEEITPKFTRNLSKIVEKISGNKYSKTKYIDEEGLIVELENGEYVNANKLSIGTIDQLYLSLRLSAMQEVTEEKMPIILDETFAYYDDERIENVLNYLKNNYQENQIIIFTCSNRERKILEKNNVEFNYINLHN